MSYDNLSREGYFGHVCLGAQYMCVNMHMIKVETLEATSTGVIVSPEKSGPNWGSNPGPSDCYIVRHSYH